MISITEHLQRPCTCAVWLKPINGELWELQLGRLIILYKENYSNKSNTFETFYYTYHAYLINTYYTY